MGWTGGQYSLYRVALALLAGTTLARATGVLLQAGFEAPLAVGPRAVRAGLLALAFALAFGLDAALAVGRRDRIAAALLAPFVLFAESLARTVLPEAGALPAIPTPGGWSEALAGRTALLPALLLALHARVPAAPFGSLDARGRVDPRGDWSRPALQDEIAWALLAAVFAARLVFAHADLPLIARGAAVFELALALLGLFVRTRRPALSGALALFVIARATATGTLLADAGLLCLLLLACRPADWPGRSLAHAAGDGPAVAPRRPARLFYDGDCGFCHRSVRFVLAEDRATPAALRLRFAPLAGPSFAECLARHPELDPAALPDSIVLELEDGRLLVRSAAALEVGARLGGLWRLLALGAGLLPTRLLDAAYDGIARIRKRLFEKPGDACPILPPDLRARFDP